MKHGEIIRNRLAIYLYPGHGRNEDLQQGHTAINIQNGLSAGTMAAPVAIPSAMGFAMALAMGPVQGITGGAVAGPAGALFGGSLRRAHRPTAAFVILLATAGLLMAGLAQPAWPLTDRANIHAILLVLVASALCLALVRLPRFLTLTLPIAATASLNTRTGAPQGASYLEIEYSPIRRSYQCGMPDAF